MTPQEVRDRNHGHPYEIVIPCMTLEEANAERADLHAAVEARAFIRPAGVTLTPEEAPVVARGVRVALDTYHWTLYERRQMDAALARLEAAR